MQSALRQTHYNLPSTRSRQIFPPCSGVYYSTLGEAPASLVELRYWAGINPDLKPVYGRNGRITDVEITYPRDVVKQELRYSEIAGK